MHGKTAHAGVEPEKGINAIVVAAEAIAAMSLGRIDEETTANIGRIQGGTATNIVPDRVEMAGEARSHDEEKLAAQVQAMTEALKQAASRHRATVDIKGKYPWSPRVSDRGEKGTGLSLRATAGSEAISCRGSKEIASSLHSSQ